MLSMSMRALIGIVQALETPGSFTAAFNWSTSCSGDIVSGVKRRNSGLSHSGDQEEYQVGTLRHSERGLSVMTVSSIDSGAGSVEVSARPALPSTRSTSGNCLISRSVTWSTRCASPIEIPGMVEGM